MPKVRITYIEHPDPKQRGSAAAVPWMGREWIRGQGQEVEANEENALLIEKARGNSTFTVEDVPDEGRKSGRPAKDTTGGETA
jgi:hypothetical protein